MKSARSRPGSSSTSRTRAVTGPVLDSCLRTGTGAGGTGAGGTGAGGTDAGGTDADGRAAGPEVPVRPRATVIVSSRSPARQLVERDVQVEHVHPRLTQEAQVPALDVGGDQRPYHGRAQVPGLGDPVHLQVGVLRGDVGVEARTGS